jgi:5-methylcytosine-specific restriction endonuclease McrA
MSTVPPKGKSSDFTAVDAIFKTCSKCGKSLQHSMFYPGKAQCKPCIWKRRRSYFKNNPEVRRREAKIRSAKYPDKIKRYRWQAVARKLALRPKITRCQRCGNDTKFRWMSNNWICVPCIPVLAAERRRARHRTIKPGVEHAERALAGVERIRRKYGERAASVYYERMQTHPKESTNPSFVKINLWCSPLDFQCVKVGAQERMAQLNYISRSEAGTIGWKCAQCGLFNTQHRFFDIDHILPRSKGGNGLRDNLQILCPNCHRIKTCHDIPISLTVDAKIGPENPEGEALNKAPEKTHIAAEWTRLSTVGACNANLIATAIPNQASSVTATQNAQ